MTMQTTDEQMIHVRVPKELHEWFKARAKSEKRSMNNEFQLILEKEKALSATNTQGFNANTTIY